MSFRTKLVLLGSTIVLFIFYIMYNDSNLTSGVSEDRIKQIRVGMTIEQLISVLGKPYYIDICVPIHRTKECDNSRNLYKIEISETTEIRQLVENEISDTNYCCSSNREQMLKGGVTFTYSKHLILPYYQMLWIHLDDSLEVESVYRKYYKNFGLEYSHQPY